jgi:hypothetical protein
MESLAPLTPIGYLDIFPKSDITLIVFEVNMNSTKASDNWNALYTVDLNKTLVAARLVEVEIEARSK